MKLIRHLILWVSLAATSLSILASGFPVTVDNCGQSLTFSKAPERMVIHDINMSEMAFALGLQPKIVGVTGITGWYKTTPAFEKQRGKIPELAAKYPSMENIIAAKPDLFFAGWNYGMRVGGPVTPDTLKPYGIKTLLLTESCIHTQKNRARASMDLLYGDMLRLGKVTGKAEQAQSLIQQWKKHVATARQTVSASHKQPVRIFLYDSGEDKPFTAGKYAMPTALIEAIGSKNIMDDLPTSWGTTSWEVVAQRQPEVIILLDYMKDDNVQAAKNFLKNHPLMKNTPAVKNQRYIILTYPEITPGPSNIGAIQKMARALSGARK